MRFPKRRFDLLCLAGLGLLVNTLAARWVSLPGYPDAYYYFNGAVQIARGHGFSEPYLWNYLSPRDPAADAARRWPSHLYWMPLTSLAAAPFVAVAERLAGGELAQPILFRAAQIPMVLAAVGLSMIGYAVAGKVTGRRRPAWAVGLLTLFSAFYFRYWTTTDAFAVFGVAASAALGLGYLAVERPQHARWLLFAAGVAAGLAHLARADGVLVVVCLGGWWTWRGRTAGQRLAPLAGLVAGYACVMGPWFIRNLLTIGALVSPGGVRAVWLITYDDFFTFDLNALTAAAYLAAGWETIVAGKAAALRANLATVVGVQANVVALPLALIGGWKLRQHPLLQLAGFYGLALFVLMTFVYSWPGARGGYFHSSAALLPFVLTAAVVGLEGVVAAAARRLRHWQPDRANPIFAGLLVAVVAAMAVAVFQANVIGPDWRQPAWGQRDQPYAEAGVWLTKHAEPDALVAVNNPPGWHYFTGGPAIVIPTGDANTLVQAMDTLGARWLLLDINHPAGLAGLYAAPDSDPRLELEATFGATTATPVYVLSRSGAP